MMSEQHDSTKKSAGCGCRDQKALLAGELPESGCGRIRQHTTDRNVFQSRRSFCLSGIRRDACINQLS